MTRTLSARLKIYVLATVSAILLILLLLVFPGPIRANASSDTIPPQVTVVSPVGTSDISGVVVSIDYFESGSSDNSVVFDIRLDGYGLYPYSADIWLSSCTDTPNVNLSCTLPDLTAGPHILEGTITDTAGNSTAFSSSFTAESPLPLSSDTIAPTYSSGSIRHLYFQAPDMIYAEYRDSPPSSGIDPSSATMSLNGEPPTSCDLVFGSQRCALPANLPPGYYRYTLSISDMAGNSATFIDDFQVGTTLHIRNDVTGGDCEQLGAWDPSTGTCTLTSDSSSHRIIIEGDNVTLDGAGHLLDARSDAHIAVLVDGGSGVTVRNMHIKWWDVGIEVDGPGTGNSLVDNNFERTITGIHNVGSADCTITGNTMTDAFYAGILGGGPEGAYIAGNDISGEGFGIYLSDSTSNVIADNRITGVLWGLNLLRVDNSTIRGNHLSGNESGVSLGSSSDDQFFDNTIENSTVAGLMRFTNEPLSPGNLFYHNSFLNNAAQVLDDVGAGSSFSLPAPVGGNYWSDWTGPDSDGDGFVDTPYVFNSAQDDLPWAASYGWERPALSLSLASVYWRNLPDYLAGLLSVDYALGNAGPDAFAVQVVDAQGSGGVATVTSMPLVLGDIPAAGNASYTLQYQLPPGVVTFTATTRVTAQGQHGETFCYPGTCV
jgi:parallel beta-helix repeat protein